VEAIAGAGKGEKVQKDFFSQKKKFNSTC